MNNPKNIVRDIQSARADRESRDASRKLTALVPMLNLSQMYRLLKGLEAEARRRGISLEDKSHA